MNVRKGSISLILSAVLLTAAAANGAYDIPGGHPRIFFTENELTAIADNCRIGGSHRAFYQKMLAFADSRIGSGKTDAKYLPSYAMVYRIHDHWNDTGYQGGGFEENHYWEFTRSALLSSSNWGIDSNGAYRAMAADWIWEKLSTSDINALANKYGEPRSYIPDSDTWRDASTYNTMTSMIRSLLFTGSAADDGDYAVEYEKVCTYIEDWFAQGMNVQGGVGSSGPQYETNLQFDRAWTFEAFSVATGIDAWAITDRWQEEWGKWIVYSKVPSRGKLEPNGDCVSSTSRDSYKNVALMAARGRDPFGQGLNDKYWDDVQNRSIADYRNCSIWCLVLWYDHTLQAYNPATAPKAMRIAAGGMDYVYMTTGLADADATWAYFEAGKNFYGHQHQDAGAFTIHRKGNLAIDSGYYGQYRSQYGDEHANNWYHRSVAHNTVSIYDPGEEFYWGAASIANGALANDGGQILPPASPTVAELLADSVFHAGEMLGYEMTDGYTYCQADLYNAYNQQAVQAARPDIPPHPNKLNHITREFVFLRPDYFVVLDRIGSVNPDFVKVWNLHVDAEPTVIGSGVQRRGNATAGIRDYVGASIAHATDDDGRLFMQALLPQDRTIRTIGGRNREMNGYAYWVGGFDGNGRYDPTEGENWYWGDWKSGHEHNEDNLPSLTIGWGRIEVEATTPANDDIFLNVLYPCDATVSQMPDTRLIEADNMVGAEIVNQRVIMFGRNVDDGIESVSYDVAPEDTSSIHTICNLEPSVIYRVYLDGRTVHVRRSTLPAPDGAEEIVTPPPAATGAGLITFDFSGESYCVVQVSGVSSSHNGEEPLAVTVEWTTDIPSTSQIEYGPTPAYGSFSELSQTLITNHALTLSDPDVLNDSLYYFRVISTADGCEAGTSGGSYFTYDVVPPGQTTDLTVVDTQ